MNYSADKTKYFFGTRRDDDATIYMDSPKWSCDWYWGFGYLGNKHEHYHLESYQNKDVFFKKENGEYFHGTINRNKNIFDCLREDYNLCAPLRDDKNLWNFCELVKTAYTLKEAAEVLGRGGSHITSNTCSEAIKNEKEVKRINEIVLPAIFQQIENILKGE